MPFIFDPFRLNRKIRVVYLVTYISIILWRYHGVHAEKRAMRKSILTSGLMVSLLLLQGCVHVETESEPVYLDATRSTDDASMI